jgi:hypothetical protein
MNQATDSVTLPLRDIHLPDTILWWPPAPGWWLLFSLIIITVFSVFYIIRHRRNQRLSAIYMAKRELERIEEEFKSNKDKSILIKDISELIRRVTISLFNRAESASLTGKQWLSFLDQLNGDNSFTNGIGRVLIEAPYQANPEYDEKELLFLISAWIDSAQKSNPSHNRSQK